jgi:1-phosphofructokinase
VIVTLTPNPSLDWTLEVPSLVPGQVHRAARERREASGKGVNVSRALTGNRVPTVAVLLSGGSSGADLEALLRGDGVPYRAVPVAGAVRVNVSVVESGGRVTKVNSPGPSLDPAEAEALLDTLVSAAADAGWVVCAGSLPPGLAVDYYGRAAARLSGGAARLALDSSGPALAAGLAARPDVVKPNVEELAEAAGRPVRTVGDAVAAARGLLDRGALSVLASLGPDGALLVSGAGVLHGEAPVAEPVSTVGAGDALLSGFLAGGGDGLGALREALAWAAAAVGVPGSVVPPVTDDHRTLVRVVEDPAGGRVLRDGSAEPPGAGQRQL